MQIICFGSDPGAGKKGLSFTDLFDRNYTEMINFMQNKE